jgi:putative ABC transport system permease protein
MERPLTLASATCVLVAVGKLKPGVSVQQAQAAMDITARHLSQDFPEEYKDLGAKVEPLQKHLFGWWASVYYMLFGTVGAVLLIACTNVANLLLVRGDGRRRELGVRIALGANQRRLIRQVLTESVLLAVIGGVAGLALSFLSVRVFNLWAPFLASTSKGFLVDSRLLLFTFGTCITGIAFGLIPARRAVGATSTMLARRRIQHRDQIASSRKNTLVVTEIALALVLLICRAHDQHGYVPLRTTPGFNPEHLLTAEVRLTGDKYIDASDPEKQNLNLIRPPVGEFCRQILDRLRNLTGVEQVALIDWLPLLDAAQYASPGFTITGQSASTEAEKPTVLRQGVSSEYFRLMGIPVLRGRAVTEQDTGSNAWVVVINEAMARRFWQTEDPIGRTIKFDDSPEETPRQIVGVVGNVKQFALSVDSPPEAYIPYQQVPARIYSGWTEARVHKSLILRTHSASKAMMENVRRTISELAPESAIFGITTVDKTVSNSAAPWRFLAQLLELFAAIALILAVIGIYGVISYSVGERRHELGLRLALGAQPGQVLGLVLRQAMVLSLIGVVIGVAGSLAATPLLADFLYGVKAHDMLTIALVSSLLMAVTFVASYVPARRATKIDPMQTRHE